MQVETQEEALFRSTGAALAFALNFSHGQCKSSAMASLMGGPKPVGRGLGGLDGSAQAGMIRAEINALSPKIRGQILVARFAVRALPCDCKRTCCSGFQASVEWLQAIADIAETVRSEALAGTVVNFLLRHSVVRRYFGDKQSLVDIAAATGVDRDTASAHAGKVIGYLKEQEQRARYDIEGRLKAAGIVE